MSKLMLVAEYQVNKNYIAEFLCVNKSKPQLKCEGKCQLSKELKAADAHEKKQTSPVKEIVEVLQFFQPTYTFSPQFLTVSKPVFRYYSSGRISASPFGIFHPPKFLV